jgi:hypothetical protein
MAIPRGWSAQFSRVNNQLQINNVKAVCPHCKTASTFAIVGIYLLDTNTGAGVDTAFHLLLRCNYAPCGKTVYVHSEMVGSALQQSGSEPFFMYPSGLIENPHKSVPSQIADDWLEAQRAMQASAPKAAAVMLRRVLYGVLIDKKCKLQPLKDGLAQLVTNERLPAIFDQWLPAIKDDGHDGAHPDRALAVSEENVSETLEYTAELLRFLYIEPYEFEQRKARNLTASKP